MLNEHDIVNLVKVHGGDTPHFEPGDIVKHVYDNDIIVAVRGQHVTVLWPRTPSPRFTISNNVFINCGNPGIMMAGTGGDIQIKVQR